MKNERFVIVALLALVAVLLMRPADAQPGASGPVEPVVVAASAVQLVGSDGTGVGDSRVWRIWSDGAVDATHVAFRGPGCCNCEIDEICGPQLVLPGSCAPDITRNGNVDFEDILPILTEWGPCDDE